MICCGCGPSNTVAPRSAAPATLPALAALGDGIGGAIVAQGKLEPAGGVLAIAATPGDRIAAIDVSAGDPVRRGQRLGEVRGLQASQTELAVAEIQLREARARAASQQAVADAQFEVARLELKQAELELTQASERFAQAESVGGTLNLLGQQVELAENKLAQLRQASADPATGRLVTSAALDQQTLTVNQTRAEWQSARRQAMHSLEAGKLAVQVATGELEAAELAIAAEAATQFESLEQQIELLRLRVAAMELNSPIDGTVLAVEIAPGEAVTTVPLMYVANTSVMVCRAEVNVADLQRIELAAQARLSSAALPRTLAGTVRSISRMVGSPRLPSPYPTAAVDWRSAEVVIELNPNDNAPAAELVNLQVDVAIEAAAPSADREL